MAYSAINDTNTNSTVPAYNIIVLHVVNAVCFSMLLKAVVNAGHSQV